MAPQVVDTIIDAGWVLPVAPDETMVLPATSVVVHGDSIVDVLATSDVDAAYTATTRLDRRSSVVMPGLINAHTHAGMSLMRGYADDMPLQAWLMDAIWPLEGRFSPRPEFARDGSALAIAEWIRGGVTCFADMYFHVGAVGDVVAATGIRAVLGMTVIGFKTAYAATDGDYLDRGREARDRLAGHPTLHFAYAPHAPYTVAPATLRRVRDLAAADDLPIHTHLHETRDECTASEALDRSNMACHKSLRPVRPVADFEAEGLLSPRLAAAHMVHLTDDEIALVAARGVNVLHCPSSNAKLASGFCPVHKLLAAGVNVALGTDSACSNNTLDMRAEMRLAALVAKNVAGDAAVLPAPTVLRMATINGARAFGLDDITGSIEVGKRADVICVDVGTNPANTPVFNPISTIVYSGSSHDVSDVLVNGRFLLRDKRYCTLDIDETIKRARYWHGEIMRELPRHPPPPKEYPPQSE